jgi:GNAT superfamily N-acetyltransferase
MPLVTDARFADSPVLCVDGRVEGMVLYEVAGETGTVQGRVVTGQYRGGWANTLLMAAAIDRGLERGVRRLRFEVPESNPDTRKLMMRVGAEVLRCTSCFARMAVSE